MISPHDFTSVKLSAASAAAAIAVSVGLYVRYFKSSTFKPTKLRGPPRTNFFFGYSREMFKLDECDPLCDKWEEEYGPVFEVPSVFGSSELLLADPKAVLHQFSMQTTIYVHMDSNRAFFENFIGQNLLTVEGEHHKRLKKALNPAFRNSEVRKMTPTFFDGAYALKNAWDPLFQESESVTIDVQQWLVHATIDAIGLSVLGHDFGALAGKNPPILDPVNGLLDSEITFGALLLNTFLPFFPTPSKSQDALQGLRKATKDVTYQSLERLKKEREIMGDEATDKSILNTFIASESTKAMTHDEILSQAHLTFIGGYEPISIALTWALIELSKKPEAQEKLREELAIYFGDDPTYDDLTNSLPYLDAVTCEVLRLHPPAGHILRQTSQDDIVPLSQPILDAEGNAIDRVYVAKGTIVRIPIETIGTSKRLWGENGREFLPERWLDDSVDKSRAVEIRGYRHLLAFSDGPRTCPGKQIALMEIKAVLSVLIRNYSFELPGGPETRFDGHLSILERPKLAGQSECKVPMIVKAIRL